MPGYLVANLDVRDPALYARYRDAVEPIVAQFGGRYLVRGGHVDAREGGLSLKRLVILEFASLDQARRFYESEEYRPAKQLRLDSCVSDVVLVEGYRESVAPPAS